MPLLWCAEEVEPWLTTQWQTEKLHILLARAAYIFDVNLTSGRAVLIFQKFGRAVLTSHQLECYI